MTSDEIESRIAAAKSGCSVSLGQLLISYQRHLEIAATLRIHPKFRCKLSPSDLVQVTLQLAYQNFSGFTGSSDGQLLSWLRAILANQHAREIRNLKTLRRDVDLEQSLEQYANDSSSLHSQALASYRDPSPSSRMHRQEIRDQLKCALSKLPIDCRRVIELRHIEERPFAEIAVNMNRSLDSVKSLWRRAILKLKASVDIEKVQ